MKRARALVAGALLAAAAWSPWVGTDAARAVTPPAEPPALFASYGTGSSLSLRLLEVAADQAVTVESTFVGQSINSLSLGAPILNEFDTAVQPALRGRNAYGRGAGLEVGILTPAEAIPDANQILLAGLAEAAAPPVGQPVVKEVEALLLPGVAEASAVRSAAQALYGGGPCLVGVPLGAGEAQSAGLDLLGSDGLAVRSGAARTRSVSYLRPEADGSFAVISESRLEMAPVSLLGGLVTIEVLGEWALRAIATGDANGASLELAPADAGPMTPVVRINGIDITLDQLQGEGLEVDLSPLALIRVGAPPREIRGSGPPLLSGDGTAAAAAADLVQITLLDLPTLGLEGADLRLGHLEVLAISPRGGVSCDLPLQAAFVPSSVTEGSEFDLQIVVPGPGSFGGFGSVWHCDLTDVRLEAVIDTSAGAGQPIELLSASDGGVIDGRSISWADLGDVRRGDDSRVLVVRARAPMGSSGRLISAEIRGLAELVGCGAGVVGGEIVAGAVSGGSVAGSARADASVAVQAGASNRIRAHPPTGSGALSFALGGALMVIGLILRGRARVGRGRTWAGSSRAPSPDSGKSSAP